MNRSICILPEVTEFSIQKLSAPLICPWIDWLMIMMMMMMYHSVCRLRWPKIDYWYNIINSSQTSSPPNFLPVNWYIIILLLSRSGWAPLLLALMYEYTNPTSHWKPYLNLVPDVTVLDQPMFWGKEERQRELDGTGIEDDVESDIHRIEEEYNTIVLPFIKKHKQYFR